MTDLTEFLLARIAEDEAEVAAFDKEWKTTTVARDVPQGLAYITDTEYMSLLVDPSRVLAECEAKRRIVERHGRCGTGMGYCDDGGHGWGGEDGLGCADLADLAAVYADHPDYRDEWKP
jgi:hypothetical protein